MQSLDSDVGENDNGANLVYTWQSALSCSNFTTIMIAAVQSETNNSVHDVEWCDKATSLGIGWIGAQNEL